MDAADIPPALTGRAGGEVATQQDPQTRQERPQTQQYLVAVRLTRPGRQLHPGGMVRVQIDGEPKTLAWRLQRWLALTFDWRP
ncbi:MAG: hypothetical protein U0736_00490 [Gemmataceae bacterium]